MYSVSVHVCGDVCVQACIFLHKFPICSIPSGLVVVNSCSFKLLSQNHIQFESESYLWLDTGRCPTSVMSSFWSSFPYTHLHYFCIPHIMLQSSDSVSFFSSSPLLTWSPTMQASHAPLSLSLSHYVLSPSLPTVTFPLPVKKAEIELIIIEFTYFERQTDGENLCLPSILKASNVVSLSNDRGGKHVLYN